MDMGFDSVGVATLGMAGFPSIRLGTDAQLKTDYDQSRFSEVSVVEVCHL